MATIMTRCGYCAKCYDANRPQPAKPFLVFGDTAQSYFIKYANGKNCTRGFTPHLYKYLRVSSDNQRVYYQQLCCMCNCGTVYVEDDQHATAYINIKLSEWSEILMMPTFRWNALVQYRDTSLMI
jgi:hypothetical protein